MHVPREFRLNQYQGLIDSYVIKDAAAKSLIVQRVYANKKYNIRKGYDWFLKVNFL